MKVNRNFGELHQFCVVAVGLLAGAASAATITVTSTADSGPDTLRQAVADALPGDTIAFDLAGTAEITLSTPLVVDKSLIIDGSTQPGDSTGTVGWSGPVGTGADGVAGSGDEPIINGTPLPKVTLVSTATTGSGLFSVQANDVTLRGLGLRKSASNSSLNGIHIIAGVSGTIIEQLMIGSSSNTAMTDPGSANGWFLQCVFNQGSGNITVTQSTIGYCGQFGYLDTAAMNGAVFTANTFYDTAKTVAWNAEPLTIYGSNYQVRQNYFNNQSRAAGSDVYGVQGATFENNSFVNNFAIAQDDDEAGSIIVRGSTSQKAVDIVIHNNLITADGNNFAAGVAVQGTYSGLGAERVTISRNAIYGNGGGAQGLGINLSRKA